MQMPEGDDPVRRGGLVKCETQGFKIEWQQGHTRSATFIVGVSMEPPSVESAAAPRGILRSTP